MIVKRIIERKCKQNRWSKSFFAKQTGVSRDALYRYMENDRMPMPVILLWHCKGYISEDEKNLLTKIAKMKV